MLGHKLYQVLSRNHDVFATIRNNFSTVEHFSLFQKKSVIEDTDADRLPSVEHAIRSVKPDVVINCIGIIKQLKEAQNAKISIAINSLFPHLIAELTGSLGIRFIHISTDCVFSGKKGMYKEDDPIDAEDIYGKTKALGEVKYDGCLTLRTSIIGRELRSQVSLIDWFLAQNGKEIKGYTKAIYSGFTTHYLAREIDRIICTLPRLSGLYQVSSEPISKFDLLCLIKNVYGLDIIINPFDGFHCDRSLDSTRFRTETGFVPPTWEEMVDQLFNDPYDYTKRQGD